MFNILYCIVIYNQIVNTSSEKNIPVNIFTNIDRVGIISNGFGISDYTSIAPFLFLNSLTVT